MFTGVPGSEIWGGIEGKIAAGKALQKSLVTGNY